MNDVLLMSETGIQVTVASDINVFTKVGVPANLPATLASSKEPSGLSHVIIIPLY